MGSLASMLFLAGGVMTGAASCRHGPAAHEAVPHEALPRSRAARTRPHASPRMRTCKLAFGAWVTRTPYRAGARDRSWLYLANDQTLTVFRFERDRLSPLASYQVPRSDPKSAVSSEIESVWARDRIVVVGTDSFVRFFDRADTGVLSELAGENHFVASFNARSTILAGGQGLSRYPHCRSGHACEPEKTLVGEIQAWDVVADETHAYTVDGGSEVVSFELDGSPHRVGTLAIANARSLARTGKYLVVSTDSGLLHVVDARDPSRMKVIDSVSGVGSATRVRAAASRVWLVGGRDIALYALGAAGTLRFLAGDSSASESSEGGGGWRDTLLDEGQALALGEAGLRAVSLEAEPCAPPPTKR